VSSTFLDDSILISICLYLRLLIAIDIYKGKDPRTWRELGGASSLALLPVLLQLHAF
jgi:hypothetical protein